MDEKETVSPAPEVTPLGVDDFLAHTATGGGFPPVVVPHVLVRGKPVFVAKLTAQELAEFYAEVKDVPDADSRVASMIFAARRPDGGRLFKPGDRVRFGRFDGDLLIKITDHFMLINGLRRGN